MRPPQSLTPILLALAAGLLLLWFATPRLISGLYQAAHDQTLRDLARPGNAVSALDAARAGESRSEALQWLETGRAWSELGAIRLLQAETTGYRSLWGRAYLLRSIAAHREGLALNPAQPYTWTRLARATLTQEGVTPALNPLLKMAVLTGPYEPRLLVSRLELGLIAWPGLDDAVRALMAEQIRIVARFYPERLARLAKRHYALSIVRDALATDPELSRRFDFVYRRL